MREGTTATASDRTARDTVGDRQAITDAPLDWGGLFERLARDRNDAGAFAALKRQVSRWAGRQLVDAASRLYREDVVAEACAEVIIKLDQARGPATFVGFVYGHYLNARRQALRDAHRPTVPLGDADPPAPADDGPSPEQQALLERCLAALPPRERRAVELRYLEDAPYGEVVAALGLNTEANARQLVHVGLKRLRRCAERNTLMGERLRREA